MECGLSKIFRPMSKAVAYGKYGTSMVDADEGDCESLIRMDSDDDNDSAALPPPIRSNRKPTFGEETRRLLFAGFLVMFVFAVWRSTNTIRAIRSKGS